MNNLLSNYGLLPFIDIFMKSIYAKVETSLFQIDPAHSWNFSRHLLKKSKQIVNNGILQEREQAKRVDVRKRNSKLSGKSSNTELGQFVVNLTRLYHQFIIHILTFC